MRYIALLLILSSCHSFGVDTIPVTYPANLTAGCNPVEKIPDNSTKNDLVDAWIDLKSDYRDVCARQAALVKAIAPKPQ